STRSEAVFRSTTLSSGALVVRQYSSQMASMSIVIPSGATLGSMAGQEFLAYVYLYYDGTADGICISTSRLDETVLHNISAISGSSNSTGVYATDSTTNAAVRLIGGIRWNSISTPGTWVTPSAVFTTHFENGLRTPRMTGTSVGIGGVAISESSGFYEQSTNSFE